MPEPNEITFRHVADELHNGTHVALLVRHAERPPIPANDPTFGRDLPLTERGVADAIRYGRELSLFACGEQMTIAAGGNRRCMETAFHILDGLGLDLEDEQYAVIADPYLGGRTYYFGDVAERMELANVTDGNAVSMNSTRPRHSLPDGSSIIMTHRFSLVSHTI